MKLTSAFIAMTIIVASTNSSSVLAQQQPSSNLESAKSRTQQLMGGVAPKLADLTDDVLYADIWERPELSKRDRSLVTVSALIALNRPDQLRSHLQRARDNGLTETELVETITHMAFYSGWPSAVSAVVIAKEVFAEK
ncbi:Carboxymuconolactone decarboxylase family protein [compost metagenome]